MSSREETFRTFTPQQAADYAQGRGGAYPSPIYSSILGFHNGPQKLVLDVGTGPGKAVWDLLGFFDRAIGCDVSPEMISQAIKDATAKGVADRARFHIAGGEDCVSVLTPEEIGTVDVITVAMAAHWLDLPAFYASAAKCLRPGGTLAMFTCSSMYIHPSHAKHKEIQAILSELEDGELRFYMKPGNILARSGYREIVLPWTSNLSAAEMFDKSSLQRVDWDIDGVPSAPPLEDGTPGPFMWGSPTTLAQMEAALGSASAVVRWREANPGKAGTSEDCVRLTMTRLRDVIGNDEHEIKLSPSTSLVQMRRL
nr:putative s-adenosylmethionine-dependent methyltransferase crg1 [Quercus suber]